MSQNRRRKEEKCNLKKMELYVDPRMAAIYYIGTQVPFPLSLYIYFVSLPCPTFPHPLTLNVSFLQVYLLPPKFPLNLCVYISVFESVSASYFSSLVFHFLFYQYLFCTPGDLAFHHIFSTPNALVALTASLLYSHSQLPLYLFIKMRKNSQ